LIADKRGKRKGKIKSTKLKIEERYIGSWRLMAERLAEVKKEPLAAAEMVFDGSNR
jgi:hypothetical protein